MMHFHKRRKTKDKLWEVMNVRTGRKAKETEGKGRTNEGLEGNRRKPKDKLWEVMNVPFHIYIGLYSTIAYTVMYSCFLCFFFFLRL